MALGVAAAVGVARWRTKHSERTGQPARTGLWALPIGAAVLALYLIGLLIKR